MDRLHCKECRKSIPAKRRRNAKLRGKVAIYDTDVCARRVARRAYRKRQRAQKIAHAA
jgi:hypothetical protein